MSFKGRRRISKCVRENIGMMVAEEILLETWWKYLSL
jgi:hypothetical protein